jgi:hypothetical protein
LPSGFELAQGEEFLGRIEERDAAKPGFAFGFRGVLRPGA